jgi:hypothetical protein
MTHNRSDHHWGDVRRSNNPNDYTSSMNLAGLSVGISIILLVSFIGMACTFFPIEKELADTKDQLKVALMTIDSKNIELERCEVRFQEAKAEFVDVRQTSIRDKAKLSKTLGLLAACSSINDRLSTNGKELRRDNTNLIRIHEGEMNRLRGLHKEALTRVVNDNVESHDRLLKEMKEMQATIDRLKGEQ